MRLRAPIMPWRKPRGRTEEDVSRPYPILVWTIRKGGAASAAGGVLELINLGKHGGGFLLHRVAHALEIRIAKLARLVFEAEVAEVLVDHFLALVEISQASLLL